MFNLFTQTIHHKWVRTSLAAFVLFVCSGAAWAQSSNAEPALGSKDSTAQSDSAIWKGELVNDEYQVFIRMNLYAQDISVPGQEIYGELPGYFGSKRSPLVWPFTSASVQSEKKATVHLVNDYGSEDLFCTLVYDKEKQTYLLHKEKGSTLKIVVNRKYVKIPQDLPLRKK